MRCRVTTKLRTKRMGWERKRASCSSSFRSDAQGRSSRSKKPRVKRISKNLAEKLLPLGATGEQFRHYFGGADSLFQRLGISLAATVLAANTNPFLASLAFTSWIWFPLAQCTRRNLSIRRAPIVGLWEAMVESAEYFLQQSEGKKTEEYVQILVGDESGARLSFEADASSFRGRVKAGQRALVLVLSDDERFLRFQAIKDVYIPELDAFVGDYPFLDRRQIRVLRQATRG